MNSELKKSEFVAERKTFMWEFDPQCRCSKKEVLRMKHVSGVEKIQKEWMLFARGRKTSSYRKFLNRQKQRMQLIETPSIKVVREEKQTLFQW